MNPRTLRVVVSGVALVAYCVLVAMFFGVIR